MGLAIIDDTLGTRSLLSPKTTPETRPALHYIAQTREFPLHNPPADYLQIPEELLLMIINRSLS